MPDRASPGAPAAPDGQLLIYQDGATRLQVRLEGRTLWLPQRLIAELFQVSVPTVSEHLANVYADRGLDPEPTLRSFRIVQTEGSREVSRAIEHYNRCTFLRFNERNILTHAGAVSHHLAEQHAHAQFEQFDAERRRLESAQPTSDFDRAVEEVKRLEAGGTPKSARGDRKQGAKKNTPKRKPKGRGE